jgi:pyruvate,water dikinase
MRRGLQQVPVDILLHANTERMTHQIMSYSHIRWFEELRRSDVAVAGGKGANLGELLRAGIPVAPGFAVTTNAYRTFLDDAGIARELHAGLDSLDVDDHDALGAAAERAQMLITDAATDPSCADAIAEGYARLGRCLVAVRSSATAEDLEEASFAGQQSTYLNVQGDVEVLHAVRACWASLFEPRAIAYRARAGIDHTAVAIAVPVQQMVQSARSGVAFSIDPITHDHGRIVIEAVRGLGEALVSGAVTPDMYAVDKATLAVVERTHVDQTRELVYAGDTPPARHGESSTLPLPVNGDGSHGHNAWRELNAVRRRRPKLNDDEIATLAELVRRVEDHYGAPQDIEWAEAGGQFYILQARPITTLAHSH